MVSGREKAGEFSGLFLVIAGWQANPYTPLGANTPVAGCMVDCVFPPSLSVSSISYLEPDVQDIPVHNDIVFALQVEFPELFQLGLAAVFDQLVIFTYFGADKAALQI